MAECDKKYPNLSPIPIVVEANVDMAARDGVIMRADVYHPTDDNRYPVLVCRTPYQKLTPRYVEIATDLAQRGYCVVVQDFRGRYASEGDYQWMWRERTETHDSEDGYDTIEWAAKLPWSDGRVGTWGHSNASWAIWMMLDSQPRAWHRFSPVASRKTSWISTMGFSKQVGGSNGAI